MTGLINYRKILLSAVVIAFVASLVFAGTQAFFSDTETSTGNTFTAGELDLTIDNSSYGFDYNDPTIDNPVGDWGSNDANSWTLRDLDECGDGSSTPCLFFDFVDLKPGDYGEDTISLHVQNDAYACMAFDLTSTPDNDINDPEADAGDVTDGADGGELQDYLSFIFWNDDGDNVLEDDETVIPELSGLPGSIFSGDWLPIAESTDLPLAAGETTYIGKGWCFGEMTATPATPADNPNGPTPGNTGFTCDGAGDHNDAQTDGISVDVHFYSEQSRNNGQFLCSALPPIDDDNGTTTEPRQLVGAALGDFSSPATSTCDAIVGDAVAGDITHTTIEGAIGSVSAGEVVCVDPSYAGTDTFPVALDVTDLTVIGLGAAGDAEIPGGFFIDASGVTVTGLEFTGYSFIASSANAAIYIHNEAGQASGLALTGTTIENNIFTAPGDAKANSANAIITETGSGATPAASGIDVLGNVIDNWHRAMFFNPTDDYEVAFNDVLNNNVGVANDGPDSSSIHNNDFEGNGEAVGVSDADNGTGHDNLLFVNSNNIADGQVNNYGAVTLDAENNWWGVGTTTQAAQAGGGVVDVDPEEAIAFPEN